MIGLPVESWIKTRVLPKSDFCTSWIKFISDFNESNQVNSQNNQHKPGLI